MSLNDMETQRHRLRRLRILQVLQQNRPDPIGDGLLGRFVREDTDLGFTQLNIRNSLDYLAELDMVRITLRTEERWMAKIAVKGIDFLEGVGDKPQGVAHPEEF